MKDKIVQTLIVVSILAGFIAFIAVEWNYLGKIIFALIFGPSLLLPSMWIVIFVATITFIFCKRLLKLMTNRVTYKNLLEHYGTHELCPKSIPVADVNEVLSEIEISEYQKRMELFSLTLGKR